MSEYGRTAIACIGLVLASGCASKTAEHGAVDVSSSAPCVTCHLAKYETTDHAAKGYPTSCENCHFSKTRWDLAVADARDPSRDVTLSALVPLYSGTSILSLGAETEVLPMPMTHASADVDADTLGQCSGCHAGADSGMFFPGVFHSSLSALGVAQPTNCMSCHARSMPTGFVGPTDAARMPASGAMKHDAVLWDRGGPTATAAVTQDCGACHASPPQRQSWATDRKYHAAVTAARQPQASSCLDCHANSRPTEVLTSASSALAANLRFDHTADEAMGECASCHAGSATSASWSDGRFHLAASATPTTCLPCHADERPTVASATYRGAPFDFGTNAKGVTHGAGQDCALCHDGPGTGGAWGGTQSWKGGSFAHGSATIATTTCVACHSTQRPDLQPGTTAAAMAALLGFDHLADGTGDCFGCHQDTVAGMRYASYLNPSTNKLPGGDWRGGQSYPGSTLVSGADGGLSLTEINLTKSAASGLVTGMTSITATLTSGMLHTASTLPAPVDPGPANAPDNGVCWHCHTSSGTTVTGYANGRFHAALASYSATPGGTVAPLPQPTSGCTECHAQVRPAGIVERAASSLQPMEHAARFTAPTSIGGVTASSAADLDCSTCHRRTDGTWNDGAFHASIGAAIPADCTACHYPGMADAAHADVTSGVDFSMRHRSGQIIFQSCQSCHPGALAKGPQTPIASTLWKPGGYHANLTNQPGACADCHSVSDPTTPTRSATSYAFALGGTATNGAQWMSHTSSYVNGRDCVVCHAADARKTGSAWTNTTSFHATTTAVTTCQGCHGLQNGNGSVPGTNNNLPATLTNSSTVTTAGADTGVPAGTFDQISHADLNVSSRDCNFCHTQVGVASAAPVKGTEWAQAKLHKNVTSLVMNGTTGRCSNCHLNVKPGPSFTFDHTSYTATSAGDCSGCHSYPGTGTTSAPNWLGAAGAPATIDVGGFTIPKPPAPSPATQPGIANLPHPASGSVACTTCHTSGAGGKPAIGYDHLSPLISTSCNACHEAGTDLVGTVWNGATAVAAGAGDSRPFTLPSVVANRGGDSRTETYPNHFYPADCGECHLVPAGNGTVTTGTAYSNAWRFRHPNENGTCTTTCKMCHTNGCPN